MSKRSWIAVAALAVFLTLFVLSCTVAAPLGYRFMGVVGNSMEPTFGEDDIVVIDIDFEEPKVGDIIAFKHNEIVVGHRIIEINENWIRTKGDNMLESDPWLVERTDIVGKKILVIPELGILIRATNTIYGFVFLIMLPAALLIWLEVKRKHRIKKEG